MKDLNFARKNAKVIIILTIVVLSIFVFIGCTSKDSKSEDKVLTAEEEKDTKRLEDEMASKLKEAKTEEEKKAITKEYSEKIESATHGKVDVVVDGSGNVTVSKPSAPSTSKPTTNKPSNNTATKPESSKPSGSTTKPESTKPSKPSEPEKKKVWVVDKPAWTEEVKKPVYAYRETWWINFGNGNIKYYYDEDEWYRIATSASSGAVQWGNGPVEEYISHYETTYVNHPEEGHWEYI